MAPSSVLAQGGAQKVWRANWKSGFSTALTMGRDRGSTRSGLSRPVHTLEPGTGGQRESYIIPGPWGETSSESPPFSLPAESAKQI